MTIKGLTKPEASDFHADTLDFQDVITLMILVNVDKCCCSLHTNKTCTIQPIDVHYEAI